MAGYDLTFTAPKSVSVLWGLADDQARAALYDAHHAALASALRFVEQLLIRTQVGAAGFPARRRRSTPPARRPKSG
ncbi:relaxase domain-containing protein [Cellulomonas composti]|uniref:TrwC relaxase domain-containing protein n=1 Tax=Cellulomonas composti TaxID=266130 RepID=A0A511JAN2_9CELL|nr:relaxase domain-containing protein [Cellulomonas composti]GEL95038.1 hypothetical protein CCO02nite_16960 [Cellulomonas composti]